MFGLPLELITMLFSTVLGGVMSMIGQNAKNKAKQQEMQMEQVRQEPNMMKAPVNDPSKNPALAAELEQQAIEQGAPPEE